jgi:hypothetical protein
VTTERLVIVDGHEDLSMGALADGRDYLTSAERIRATMCSVSLAMTASQAPWAR